MVDVLHMPFTSPSATLAELSRTIMQLNRQPCHQVRAMALCTELL